MNLSKDVGPVLIPAERIQQRVKELGAQLAAEYAGKDLLLVGVLKGAIMFMVDLARAIDLPLAIDFMAISSYGASTKSSGVVRVIKDLDESIENKHVLVVEDIVDSGLTLRYILDNLAARRPASLKVCALLDKQTQRKAEVPLDYVGFRIPDRFVIGYGLDRAEIYRNLPHIAVLD